MIPQLIHTIKLSKNMGRKKAFVKYPGEGHSAALLQDLPHKCAVQYQDVLSDHTHTPTQLKISSKYRVGDAISP